MSAAAGLPRRAAELLTEHPEVQMVLSPPFGSAIAAAAAASASDDQVKPPVPQQRGSDYKQETRGS